MHDVAVGDDVLLAFGPKQPLGSNGGHFIVPSIRTTMARVLEALYGRSHPGNLGAGRASRK
jgi:hypothetical protein